MIKTVATHHTASRIRQQFSHGVTLEASLLIFFADPTAIAVGGVDCQTCHGPVEEMEVMYQHSSLTMGWCINCHRETNLKVEDNEYYAKIHEQLSKKYGVEKLTVAQMGGLECGKCHY